MEEQVVVVAWEKGALNRTKLVGYAVGEEVVLLLVLVLDEKEDEKWVCWHLRSRSKRA